MMKFISNYLLYIILKLFFLIYCKVTTFFLILPNILYITFQHVFNKYFLFAAKII